VRAVLVAALCCNHCCYCSCPLLLRLTQHCDEHLGGEVWAVLLQLRHQRQHVGGQAGALVLVQD
jgi:hypothetical protein